MCNQIADAVIKEFGMHYQELTEKREQIIGEISKEEEKFGKTVANGMKELEKILEKGTISSEQAFILYSTYGFPLELTEEIVRERGGSVDHDAFKVEFEKHQELSRAASAGMFKGG
jgi:alanyl-tRNA synthetase